MAGHITNTMGMCHLFRTTKITIKNKNVAKPFHNSGINVIFAYIFYNNYPIIITGQTTVEPTLIT